MKDNIFLDYFSLQNFSMDESGKANSVCELFNIKYQYVNTENGQ